MPSSRYQRPELALRLGVTGVRKLEATQLNRIERQVREVLAVVREAGLNCAERPAIKSAYAPSSGGPAFWFLSPLAAGSDQLAARCAVELGFQLYVPMPFARDEYEADFKEDFDREQFMSLMEKAGDAWFAIDGARGEFEPQSYEAVGRIVARHCDILIAIWDGKPGKGVGGTHDTVMFALATGTPLVWIDAHEDVPPRWISENFDLTHPNPAASDAAQSIRIHLETLIAPPTHLRRPHDDWIDRIANIFRKRLYSPHEDHFGETERPTRWVWHAYSTFIRLAARKGASFGAAQAPDRDPPRYWYERYKLPDSRSSEYAARYRSAFVWVFLLGTLSLIAGTTALFLTLVGPVGFLSLNAAQSMAGVCALAELVCLVLILALVTYVRHHDWHERSIEYRLLAELCRKQQALAPIGWSVPIRDVRTLIEDEVDDHGEISRDRATWVAWLFFAELRAAPLPRGNLTQDVKAFYRSTIMADLISGQIDYHTYRRAVCEAAGRRLEHFGFIVFIAVIVSVVAKLVLSDGMNAIAFSLPFGWFAAVLPGVSAALVGINAYAELQLLAAQSKHMKVILERGGARIARIDSAGPLASQELGAETANIAGLMLQDLEGWARLFRIKGAEVG